MPSHVCDFVMEISIELCRASPGLYHDGVEHTGSSLWVGFMRNKGINIS